MRRKMGGKHFIYKVTFERLPIRTESGRRTSTPTRVSSAAASTPGRSTGQRGGAKVGARPQCKAWPWPKAKT